MAGQGKLQEGGCGKRGKGGLAGARGIKRGAGRYGTKHELSARVSLAPSHGLLTALVAPDPVAWALKVSEGAMIQVVEPDSGTAAAGLLGTRLGRHHSR